MAERTVVTKDERVSYEGIFDIKDTIKMLKKACEEKTLDCVEQKHVESVTDKGRYITINFAIGQALTDYAKEEIPCGFKVSEMKNKLVEIKGKKRTMQTGKVEVKFDGILRTDYEGRWEMKPGPYFLRTLFEQFIYPAYLSRQKKKIKSDVEHLKNSLKTYFNLQRY